MICFPNAKINLGLNIISKREDGYHNIETAFYPISVSDALEIVPASGDKGTFNQSGIPMDGSLENNLVIKALRILQCRYEIPEIDIYLRKNIPFGAGLGGGSSDASFMLKLVNHFAELKLDNEQLKDLAALIGADCPFFIENLPVFAEGTGNVFSPVALSLKGYHLILIRPDIHIATKDAYARVQPRKPKQSVKEIICQPVNTWKEVLVNDFEPGIFAIHPEIREIKNRLYDSGAVYASMSGSGSAVFGIFDAPVDIPYFDKKVYQTRIELN